MIEFEKFWIGIWGCVLKIWELASRLSLENLGFEIWIPDRKRIISELGWDRDPKYPIRRRRKKTLKYVCPFIPAESEISQRFSCKRQIN